MCKCRERPPGWPWLPAVFQHLLKRLRCYATRLLHLGLGLEVKQCRLSVLSSLVEPGAVGRGWAGLARLQSVSFESPCVSAYPVPRARAVGLVGIFGARGLTAQTAPGREMLGSFWCEGQRQRG